MRLCTHYMHAGCTRKKNYDMLVLENVRHMSQVGFVRVFWHTLYPTTSTTTVAPPPRCEGKPQGQGQKGGGGGGGGGEMIVVAFLSFPPSIMPD